MRWGSAWLVLCLAACAPQGERPPAERVVVAPTGEVAAPPLRYSFPVTPGAARYRLSVQDAAGREIARAEGTGSPLFLAEPEARYFVRGERYRWTVEPLGGGGMPVGTPTTAEVVVRP